MKETVIKINYHEYEVHPHLTGFYVHEYKDIKDFNEDIPCDIIGPFLTRAAAARSVLEASDIKDRREREHKNHEPSLADPAKD